MLKKNRTPENAVRTAIHIEVVGLSVGVLKKIPRRKLAGSDKYYTGNTLFSSSTVLAEFFRCGFMEHVTGKKLGYSPTPDGQCGVAVHRRIRYVQEETRNLYEAYRDFNKSGHVTQPLAWVLDPERHPKRGKRYGKNRRNMSVRLCQEMIAYHMGSRLRASKKTGVPRSTINFWLNLGVVE